MQIQGTIGPVATSASLSAGSQQNVRMGNMGELIKSDLHGRYYEQAYRKSSFGGSTGGVVATALAAGLVTAMTGGLVLANPVGNSFNLVLQKVGISFVLAQTNASTIGIMVGQSSTALSGTLTSMTPRCKNIGSNAAPTGLLYSSASITLPVAPTLDTILGTVDTGALTVSTSGVSGTTDLEGSIILPPGAFAAIYSSAAGTASSLIAAFGWEEVPI